MINGMLLLMVGALNTTAANTAFVDPSIRYQTWEGFGTSLAWWSHIVGAYPEPLRTTLVDKVIGGLQLNVLRYNIGGGEAPGLNFMEQRARVPGYMHPDGSYDWNADAAQRWVLQRGKKLGANKFEAFSNSPPYFMTVSGSVTGGYGGKDNLKPEKLDAFAAYLVNVTKYFKSHWGIQFESLDPMNEPGSPWWTHGNRQEGCRFSAGENQSNLIVATGAALAGAKLKTRVSACDESYNSWAVSSWDSLSSEAKGYVMRLNTHCYSGSSQHWVNHRAVRDSKRLWMSEYGDGDASGMQTAHQMVTDLKVMMPSAWVYWQIIDGGYGWGCIDMDLNNHSHTYTINRKYYTFGQFSNFIRPGAQFIYVSDPNTVCVQSGTKIVMVTVSDSAQSLTYDLSAFTNVGATVSVTQTSPTENLASLAAIPVANDTFTAELPANSVTTFVIDGCTFGGHEFDGFQTIASHASTRLLGDPGASWSNGQLLATSAANGAYSQQWRVEGESPGWYKLCNRESGLYASLWDSSANHYPVLQWEDNGDTTIPWSLTPQPDGTYRMSSYRYSTMVLTENQNRGNGWPDVVASDWSGAAEERWAFAPAAPLYPNPPLLNSVKDE